MRSKKGQMEMMGLAIIVILLALGVFFIIQFTISEQKDSPSQSAQIKLLLKNFPTAFLLSESGCEGTTTTFTQLINDLEDPMASHLICKGKSGDELVDYFNETVSDLLNQTLGLWGYNYLLSVEFDNSAPVELKTISINNVCVGAQKDSSEFPFRGDYGLIRVTLAICY